MAVPSLFRWTAWLSVFAVSSCGDDAPPPAVSTPLSVARPNYEEDIHAIFAEQCVRCHLPGGFAGVQLNNYEGAAAAAAHLPHVIAEREMPPWGTDDGGRCGDWAASRWLPQEQINTVLSWVSLGVPKGDPAKRRLPAASTMPTIPDAAARVEVGAGYLPTPGGRTIRCFTVDPALKTDQYLTGLGFESKSPFAIVQTTLFAIDSPENEARIAALAAPDGNPGFPCTGSVAGARFVHGVTTASAYVGLPEGTGVSLRAGTKLVVQVHYNLFARGTDQGAVLFLDLKPHAREGKWTEVRATTLSVAPGLADTTEQARFVVPAPMTVMAVYPQMRLFGTGLLLNADLPQAGGRRCMLNQTKWQFHMLREPRVYSAPQALEPQSLLTLTCHYDTRGASTTVHEGDQLEDEECAVQLYAPTGDR
jgi:hypothetical protein